MYVSQSVYLLVSYIGGSFHWFVYVYCGLHIRCDKLLFQVRFKYVSSNFQVGQKTKKHHPKLESTVAPDPTTRLYTVTSEWHSSRPEMMIFSVFFLSQVNQKIRRKKSSFQDARSATHWSRYRRVVGSGATVDSSLG